MSSATRIKDHLSEASLFERRAALAAAIIVVAFGVLIARLVWLQIVRHGYYAGLSQGNRARIEPLPPSRGLILDRNGAALATSRPAYQLELTPERVPDLDRSLRGLAALGLLQMNEIPSLKRDILGRRPFDSIPIRLQLDEIELARFAARRHDYPGVEIRPRLTRFYPFGASSAHAIGYVGIISEEDRSGLDLDQYNGIKLIGKNGIEREYEKELRGRVGFEEVLVNATGRRIDGFGRIGAELKRQEPVAGNDLFLTIDHRVQAAAEEALRGHRAAAVAIDPANGDVIAFVSTPAFDPNAFARSMSRSEYLRLTADPQRPMYDRAARGTYPPGSTIKPVMALAALEYGVIGSHDARYCPGVFRLPGVSRPWRDWKISGHGAVDMRKALATSCDIYFYDLANKMGIDRIHDFLAQFGLGGRTGIDIPGEGAGILPSTAWKKSTFRRKEQQVWYAGDTVSIGIGQGYMAITPLQLAHVTATIAARGKRFKPRLVKAIRDASSGAVNELAPVELPPVRTTDANDWTEIIEGMVDVTSAPYGGARRMGLDAPYVIAGKSGTAQVFTAAANKRVPKAHELVEALRDHALFIAFAPADSAPKIAVAVVVENAPASGALVAAPVARRILDAYLLPQPEPVQKHSALSSVTSHR